MKTKTNTELATEMLPAGDHHAWGKAIPFLDNRVKIVDPACHRENVYNDVSKTVLPLVTKAQMDVVELMLAAEAKVIDAEDHLAHKTREDPFVALLLYFDMFILGPAPKEYKGYADLLVKRRIRDMYEGRIIELYREAYLVEGRARNQ